MKIKKRALTLLEIMIVIALITLITGVIGYNMRGTLDRGRAFRTEQAKEQLQDLLQLSIAEGNKPRDIVRNPAAYIEQLGLAKKTDQLLKDGWGKDFTIRIIGDGTEFDIVSDELERHKNKRKIK